MKKFVKKALGWLIFYAQLPLMYFVFVPMFTIFVHLTCIIIGIFTGFNEQIDGKIAGAYDEIVQIALDCTKDGYNRAKNAG